MRNTQVARSWAIGRPAATKHLKTDGKTLWSYELAIGETDEWDGLVIKNYTAASNRFISQTTSTHVNIARRTCCCMANVRVEVPE